MKKLTYIILATSMLLATGCTNELETTMQDGKLSFSSVSASMADLPTSRAHLEGGGKVVWDAGDNIGIYSDTQTTPVMFTCTDVSESNATFSSDDEVSGSNFVAYYPYWNTTIDGNIMNYMLVNSIEYIEGSYYRQCPMIAKSTTNEFSFKHTCGVIRFSITGTQRIQSLILEGNNGEVIAGMGTIDLTSDVPIFVASEVGHTDITMSTTDVQLSSTATDFYFIVPVIEFSKGLSLTINYLSDDSLVIPIKKTTTNSITISRSVIKSFSVFDTDVLIQEQEEDIEIPDLVFKKYCVDNFDINNDGEISYREAENITSISIYSDSIESLKGIEHFTNLYFLQVNPRNDTNTAMGVGGGGDTGQWRDSGYYLNGVRVSGKLKDLDISKNIKLKYLDCSGNLITKLDLLNNEQMEYVDASFNLDLDTLLFTNKNTLNYLKLTSTSIQNLDVSIFPNLTNLQIDRGLGLTSLDVSKNLNLSSLNIAKNSLKFLDITNNVNLTQLDCSMGNLTELDISKNTNLIDLFCPFNNIENINVTNNLQLQILHFHNNRISDIDVSMLPNLNSIHFGNYQKASDGSIIVNTITDIDLSKNTNLEHVFGTLLDLKQVDITNNTKLKRIFLEYNLLDTLNVCHSKGLEELYTYGNPNLSTIYISPEQNFIYIKDEHTSFTFAGGSPYYCSTDYSKDGEVIALQTATIGNGIDIVLMGDGYSDRLITDGTYDNTMKLAMEKLFSVEPYKSYRDYFNVYAVKVVSSNETYAFGSTTALSCYFGGGTLVGGNDQQVFNYAQKAISAERMNEALLIVMMNSTEYAGTCYMYSPSSGDYGNGISVSYFPVGADETALEQIIHHEASGHGFAKLGDEYAYEDMGAVISDYVTQIQEQQNTWGWWKNVDFTSDVNTVRWNKFLSDSRYANEGLGAYEGGLTYWTGVWRPTENSIMRYNTGGFNAPSREAIYYRINKLAYGEDWTYDYETFVEYDAINRISTASRAVTNFKQMLPLHDPIIIKGSWKDAKNTVPARSASNTVKSSAGSNLRKVSTGTETSKVTNRRTLTDGRIMITTIDGSGKVSARYE